MEEQTFPVEHVKEAEPIDDKFLDEFWQMSPERQKEVVKAILFDYIDGGMIAEILEMIVEVEKEVR